MTDNDPFDRAQWPLFEPQGPPQQVAVGWRQFAGMSAAARKNIWPLLERVLESPDDTDNAQVFQAFAQRFEVNPSNLLAALSACEWLLRRASAGNIPEEAFREQMKVFAADGAEALEALASRYVPVLQRLRERILEDTLAEHGNVLLGFDWRLDQLDTSSRGTLHGIPVVFLNLHYRSGDKRKRLALQLTPAAVHTLSAFCGQLAREGDQAGPNTD